MDRFVDFGSIGQFRQVVERVRSLAHYAGRDADGKPRYDESRPLPVVEATLTEKIHGTNGGVCCHPGRGIWAQSKEALIRPDGRLFAAKKAIHKALRRLAVQGWWPRAQVPFSGLASTDNLGCAAFVLQRRKVWEGLARELAEAHGIDMRQRLLAIYFEWAGEGIERKSALAGLARRALLFPYFQSVSLDPAAKAAAWHATALGGRPIERPQAGIHNLMSYAVRKVVIDFSQPEDAQQALDAAVAAMEASSPVGEAFGKPGRTGEGVVGHFWLDGRLHRFKAKGERHAVTKAPRARPQQGRADTGPAAQFASEACPAWRLEQAWGRTFPPGILGRAPSARMTGDFLKAVAEDVFKEEADRMAALGVAPRQAQQAVTRLARAWFMERLERKDLHPQDGRADAGSKGE